MVDSPGINADFSFSPGYDDSLETAMDWEKHFGNDVKVSSVMFNLGLWYNFYFSTHRSHGLFLRLPRRDICFGGFWSKRAMNVDVVYETNAEVTSSKAIHDTDSLTKPYAIMGYRF